MALGNTLNILRPPVLATMPVQTGWNEDLVKNMHDVLGRLQQQVSALLTASTLNTAPVPFVVVISGQSNAAGSNSGGTNLASSQVRIWDGVTNAWGSSDYTANPLLRAVPDGNGGNNNIAVAFADRVRAETGRIVYIIIDTASASIGDWVDSGVSSVRYAALKTKVDAAFLSTELSSVSKIDAFLWVQGEADSAETQATHLADLQTLVTQLRAEVWCDNTVPLLMHGLSDLHERREAVKAIRELSRIDPFVTYVNSRGLATSDSTHFTGVELYRTGYYTVWQAYQQTPLPVQIPNFPFRNRHTSAVGEEWTIADDAMILPTGTDIWMGVSPGPNVAGGSIVSGTDVDSNAVSTLAFGNTINITAGAFGAGVFGHQVDVSGTGDYSLSCGRGYENQKPHALMGGQFPTSPNTDKFFVIGYGASSGSRKDAITIDDTTGHTAMVGVVTVPGATLTLASDIITVTHSFHLVAGQSGANDDLVTINGGVAGQRLVLRPSSDSVTITVKSTGNIVQNTAGDFVMNNQDDTVELIYDAARSKWLELSRSSNGT